MSNFNDIKQPEIAVQGRAIAVLSDFGAAVDYASALQHNKPECARLVLAQMECGNWCVALHSTPLSSSLKGVTKC